MPSNPFIDAWLAAWTNSLNLSSQLSRTWFGGHGAAANPWAALAMPGAMSAGNPWSMSAGGAAANPMAMLAGAQSMLSLLMAPWGGATPQVGVLPWPWNAAGLAAGRGVGLGVGLGAGMGGWPAAGPWGLFGAGPAWPLTIGFPGLNAAVGTQPLPWPWTFLAAPQQTAGLNPWGWPQGGMGMFPGAMFPGLPGNPADSDPMGFGPVMRFWSSLVPGAGAAPQPVAPPANPSTDLTKLFPWMAWLK
jgi:hypothetical protein